MLNWGLLVVATCNCVFASSLVKLQNKVKVVTPYRPTCFLCMSILHNYQSQLLGQNYHFST